MILILHNLNATNSYARRTDKWVGGCEIYLLDNGQLYPVRTLESSPSPTDLDIALEACAHILVDFRL